MIFTLHGIEISMYFAKVFFIWGLIYIFMGLFNLRTEWGEKLYKKFWEMEPPTNYEFIVLGAQLIVLEVFFDIIVNLLIFT